jgi:hypothetical protein
MPHAALLGCLFGDYSNRAGGCIIGFRFRKGIICGQCAVRAFHRVSASNGRLNN